MFCGACFPSDMVLTLGYPLKSRSCQPDYNSDCRLTRLRSRCERTRPFPGNSGAHNPTDPPTDSLDRAYKTTDERLGAQPAWKKGSIIKNTQRADLFPLSFFYLDHFGRRSPSRASSTICNSGFCSPKPANHSTSGSCRNHVNCRLA